MEFDENKHKYNLFYALQEGELKHISEVANGLKCKCICPACEKKLVARNGGSKRIHHFAHYESAECKYGVQTSIHLAAKSILEKERRIKIPSVNYFIFTEVEIKKGSAFISNGEFHEISKERYIEFEDVILERKLHKFIPDVVLISKNKRLIIENAVTHFVGRKKLKNIIDSKTSAIEIDLSKIDNDFKIEDLSQLIIDNLENKSWLHNQKCYEEKNDKQLVTYKKIESRNKKKWDKWEKKEEWYKQYYREVIYRKLGEDYFVKQIDTCPLKKRFYDDKLYASVSQDCSTCEHSRKEREKGKYLICLYEYHNRESPILTTLRITS